MSHTGCWTLAVPMFMPYTPLESMWIELWDRPQLRYSIETLCGWFSEEVFLADSLRWGLRRGRLKQVTCGACCVRIDALMEKYDF